MTSNASSWLGTIRSTAPAAPVHLGATQLLLGQLLAGAAAHDRRAGDEQLAETLDHDGEVRHDQPGGAQPDGRPEGRRHHRHQREVVDDGVPAGFTGT